MVCAGSLSLGVSAYASTDTGPNLIPNPSLETLDSTGLAPANWKIAGFGSNTFTTQYPVAGCDGTKAARIDITSYTSGDRKWIPVNSADPHGEFPIKPGHEYHFVDCYSSTIPTTVTFQFRMADGTTLQWIDRATPVASPNGFTKVDIKFLAPLQATTILPFHLINGKGTLIIDNFQLHEETEVISPPQPLPPPALNLFANGTMDQVDANGNLIGWNKGGFGNNVRTLTVTDAQNSISGLHGLQTTITQYVSGDAKWYPTPIQLAANHNYEILVSWSADVPSHLGAWLHFPDGHDEFPDLLNGAELDPSFSTQGLRFRYIAPDNVKFAVLPLLRQIGTLKIGGVGMVDTTANPNYPGPDFPYGTVSADFDDGFLDAFINGIPRFTSAGFKTSNFIITGRFGGTDSNGNVIYLTKDQVAQLQLQGHEIGAHTRTHQDLTSCGCDDEIANSRQDLIDLGFGAVYSFAYPFGAYNDNVISLTEAAGYLDARTSDGGTNTVRFSSDSTAPFRLVRMGMQSDTSIDNVKAAIDAAVANHWWLILVFHHVNDTGDGGLYQVSTAFTQQVVDYLVSKQVPVLTNGQAAAFMYR